MKANMMQIVYFKVFQKNSFCPLPLARSPSLKGNDQINLNIKAIVLINSLDLTNAYDNILSVVIFFFNYK